MRTVQANSIAQLFIFLIIVHSMGALQKLFLRPPRRPKRNAG